MALNLNSSPYFDNFDDTKNYSRILFKPGVAVQARELTQLQTALSDQLEQLGSFSLKEGAIISGCEEKVSRIPYIKITDSDFDGVSLVNGDLKNYVGSIVTGGSTGLRAKIVSTKTGTTGETPDTKTLYITYIDSNSSTNTNGVLEFEQGETLTVDSEDSTLNGDTFVTYNSASATVGSRDRYSGFAPFLTLSPGIIFALGTFIRTTEISTFIDNYTQLSDRKVGFVVTEKIVKSADDQTLLDPATGSFNFNAPGADRLQQVVTLKSFNNTETLPDNFFQYASWEFGKIVRSEIKSDPLGEISRTIAERTYNANGNYVVSGLQTSFREHLDDGNNGGLLATDQGGLSTKLVATIRPGNANVAGYPVELLAPKVIPFDKPSATRIEETVAQSTSFGNYVIVADVAGAWDVDGSDGVAGNGIVDLYDAAQDAVTDDTFSATSASGNKVGTAKTRHIVLHSGTPGTAAAQYKLYLYDIKMSKGNFKDVEGIVYENTNANAFADIVLESGDAVLKETNFNKLLWNLPYSHLKTLQADSSAYDYNFKFTREFDLTADLTGVINVAAGIANQTFFFGNGAVSDSNITANMQLLATDQFVLDGTTIKEGEYIDLSGLVTQNSETSLTIDLGTAIVGASRGVRLFVNMQVSDTAPIAKTLLSDRYVKIDATTNANSASGKYSLGISDVFKIKQILATDNSDYTTNTRDVTTDFILDRGQRENVYGLASIQKRSGSSLDTSTYRYITVKLDYFSRTVSGPTFACVDSYPVDDTGASGIKTEEIPIFSSSSGNVYDLKNAIDFRPYIANTAANSTSIAGATENPSILEDIDRPSNGLTNPVPTQEFTTDLEYYLAEAYRVVITEERKFRVVKSAPGISPQLPSVPQRAMTLATGFLPPYPCISKKAAKITGRQDLSVSIKIQKNKRYRMRDIGALEERISNLEYYTALTLLEKQAGEVKILDGDGVDRFKNGFLVDSFTGFGVNSVTHQDNNCSIDKKKRQLRAAFKSSVIGFKPSSVGSTVGQTGDMFHVPYTETIYASQLQASKYRNVVGELLIATDAETDPPAPTPTTPVTPTVPPIPVDPGEPTFALVRSKTSVNEGRSFTITLETDNVAEGTLVPYTITGTGITTADIGGASLTGNFTVDAAGDAFQTFNVTADATTEGAETFTLTLDGKSISTSVTFNDTSTTIIVDPPLGPYIGSMSLTPSEDTWFDINFPPEAYTNNDGEHDNLTAGTILSAEGRSSGWRLEWGAWEYVASTVGAEYPGDQFGVEFDGNTSQVDNGLYVPSYGVTWTNESTIPAQSTTTWETRAGSYVWQGPETVRGEDELDYIEDVEAYARPVSISGSVEGLLPNDTHNVSIEGVRKGSFTSNANGRGSFSVSIGSGEFLTGHLNVQVANTESIASATSYAQAGFVSNYQVHYYKATYISTKLPYPSTPIVPEVRSITTDDPVEENKGTIETETSTATTDVIAIGDVIITTKVKVDEIDMTDKEISTSCDLTEGISRAIMERPDGTQYGIEIDDRGCYIHDAYIATKAKPVVVGTGETYDPTTRTTTTNDASVNTIIIQDEADLNVDANSGGKHVVTATEFKDELNITVVNSENDDFNIVENVTLTVANTSGATASTEVVEKIANTTIDNTVNDATTDSTLNAVVEAAIDFDFNAFDLFCIGELWGSGGADDPLAQTFLVEDMPGGMFITSADIFFRSISAEENNNGIKLQIREVINGVPGPTIVPNGEVHVRRSHCYTSTIESDGTVKFAATNFKFKNPVHLNDNTEYCMVLKPDANDPGYEAWIAELGGTEVGKTSVVSKQAHSGVLFTSANNRSWSPHQSEDLMFTLRRAKFEVNTDVILNVENKNTDWIKIDSTTWDTTTDGDGRIPTPRFVKGDAVHGFTITLDTAGAGYTDGTYDLVFTNTGTNGTNAAGTYVVSGGVVTSVTLTNPGSGYTSAPTVALSNGSPTTAGTATLTLNRGIHKFYDRGYSTYELDITDGFFTVGDMIGNGTTFVDIESINNRAVSALVLKAATINPDDRGTITPKMALTKTSSSTANTDTYSDVTLQTTQELSEEKTIFSYSNEQARDDEKTARFKFTLNTTANNVSPMIDLATLDMLALVNDINSPVVAEEVTVGGNANSKYISKQVILAEGQDGEDFKVYLDSAIPSGAGVEVYAKLQNAADDANFLNDIYWKKLEIDDQPFVSTESLAEYSYKIPDKASGFGLNGSGILEYDVERVSEIAITSGGAGYASAPTITLTDSDGNGYGAVAEAVLTGNAVTSIRILDPGREYTGTVTATVSGGSPSTAAVLGTVTKETVTYTGFKYFAVKIVHLSSDTAIIPKSSGLRAYALQA